jgi:hypothetical protein
MDIRDLVSGGRYQGREIRALGERSGEESIAVQPVATDQHPVSRRVRTATQLRANARDCVTVLVPIIFPCWT